MNGKEFFLAVAKMRQLQNQYFANRKSDPAKAKELLKESLAQEKLIDDEIDKTCRTKGITL